MEETDSNHPTITTEVFYLTFTGEEKIKDLLQHISVTIEKKLVNHLKRSFW